MNRYEGKLILNVVLETTDDDVQATLDKLLDRFAEIPTEDLNLSWDEVEWNGTWKGAGY
jgi:hypothetical protein